MQAVLILLLESSRLSSPDTLCAKHSFPTCSLPRQKRQRRRSAKRNPRSVNTRSFQHQRLFPSPSHEKHTNRLRSLMKSATTGPSKGESRIGRSCGAPIGAWLTRVVSTTDPDATLMPALWARTPSGIAYPRRGRWWQGEDHHCCTGDAFRASWKTSQCEDPRLPHAHTTRNCGRARRQETRPTSPTTTSWRSPTSTCVPMCLYQTRDQRTPFYGQREFHYDAKQDVSRCPNGALLHLEKHRDTERTKAYRAGAATRPRLPASSAHRTDSERGRSLRRSFHGESLERVRTYHTTEPYHKAMRKRRVWVEPLSARSARIGMV